MASIHRRRAAAPACVVTGETGRGAAEVPEGRVAVMADLMPFNGTRYAHKGIRAEVEALD